MEKTIICAIVACYAVFVDLQAAILHSRGDTFQAAPLTVWAAVISIVAIAEILFVFGAGIRKNTRLLRKRLRRRGR